jgi:DNA-binding response OmpR family regulator
MKLGILEDNITLARLLTLAFTTAEHQVSTHTNASTFLADVIGEEGVSSNFDALIIDLILPGQLSGTEVVQQVRKTYPELPIIIISAAGDKEIDQAARELRMVTIIRKPFRIQSLLATIEMLRCQ